MIKKKWYLSKMFWANVCVFLVGVGTSLTGHLETGIPLTLVSVVNLVLRAYTKSPIFI